MIRFISQYTLFFQWYRFYLQVPVNAKRSLFGPLPNELFWHFLFEILTCSARHFSHCHRFNSYLSYWSLCYNYLQFKHLLLNYLPHGNINDSLTHKLPRRDQHREHLYVCEWAERASLEIFRIYTYQNSYFFPCLSGNKRILSAWYDMFLGYIVTCVHSMQFPFKIHWASKETYHLFRVTFTEIHCIKMIHVWTQIR